MEVEVKKQVNIKCIANKYLNECNYYVFVYLNNKTIFEGYLNSSKILNLKLLPCKYYKIIIRIKKLLKKIWAVF